MRYSVILLVAIGVIILVVSVIFCLSASEIVQLAVAGATLLLAIAAFESIKGSEKQFVKSKSPVFKIDLKNWNVPSSYKDENGKDFFSDNITLNIKNVGFAIAFNIRIVCCKRAGKSYDVDLGNKLTSFDLEQGETRLLKCSCAELSKEDLEKPIIIDTEYIGILGNGMKQTFKLPTQFEGEYVTAQRTYLDFGIRTIQKDILKWL